MNWYKRLTKPENLMVYGLYKDHKAHNKSRPSVQFENKTEMFKVVRAILKEIAKSFLEDEEGVVLDRLGYLAVWKSPVKRIKKGMLPNKKKLNINAHTQGYMYTPTLFTDVFSKTPFRFWTMDRAFTEDIKSGLAAQLRKGVKYKLRHTLVKSMFNTYKRKQNQLHIDGV
jgi:ligand-binding SRPBCC domain-containing protein